MAKDAVTDTGSSRDVIRKELSDVCMEVLHNERERVKEEKKEKLNACHPKKPKKKWWRDGDNFERVRVFFVFCIQIYKIVMGTFLSVFVPHSCGHKSGECTYVDSLYDDTTFSIVTLAINAITCFFMFVLYGMELLRENWFIIKLDIDHSQPDDDLKQHWKTVPQDIRDAILRWNFRYYVVAMTVAVMALINLIVSLVFLILYWSSASTIITYASFSLLISNKIIQSFLRARDNYKKQVATSSYMMEYTSFNVLDEDEMMLRGLEFDEDKGYRAATTRKRESKGLLLGMMNDNDKDKDKDHLDNDNGNGGEKPYCAHNYNEVSDVELSYLDKSK